MKDYNWDNDDPNIAAANEENKAAAAAAKLAEKLYRERDALMPDVKGIVASTRDVLKGTYKKSPKTLVTGASRWMIRQKRSHKQRLQKRQVKCALQQGAFLFSGNNGARRAFVNLCLPLPRRSRNPAQHGWGFAIPL